MGKISNMKTTVLLALKNLTRQKRRSLMLALAISFGFFIVTAIDGIASGAMKNLVEHIVQMQGGNVIVQGLIHQTGEDGEIIKKYSFVIDEPEFLEQTFLNTDIEYEAYACRTMTSGTIVFNGKKIDTNIFGCNYQKEKKLTDSFIVLEGNIEDIYKPYSMVITKKSADSLNIKVGDKVLYITTTVDGQRTVGEFTISLIVKDDSIMNTIMIYVPIESLNELYKIKPNEYNQLSVFVENSKQNLYSQMIEDKIREAGRVVTSRKDAIKEDPTNIVGKIRKQAFNNLIPDTIYVVASLNDAVPVLGQIVSIVHSVTTMILIVIMLIVMVGISNTYRMIMYERIKEIGTMRAVGMTGKQTGKLFTTEAVILSLIGAIVGVIVALIFMTCVCSIQINFDAFSFFMKNNHLTYEISVGSMIGKYIIMILLTIIAVRGTSKSVSRLSPAQALR